MTDGLRLVLIEWHDAYGCSPSWTDIEDVQPETLTCRSVGWLAYDGEDYKVVVPHMAGETSSSVPRGCGDMTIPTACVVRVVDLLQSHEILPGPPASGLPK